MGSKTEQTAKKALYAMQGAWTSLHRQWDQLEQFRQRMCSNMGGVGGHYAERKKSEKAKYCMESLRCGIYKIQRTSERNEKEADSQIQIIS